MNSKPVAAGGIAGTDPPAIGAAVFGAAAFDAAALAEAALAEAALAAAAAVTGVASGRVAASLARSRSRTVTGTTETVEKSERT
jgi:hypothetical protein